MLGYFKPDQYIESFTKLKIETLKKRGITLFICDIDNTLVAHDVALPNDEVKSFIKSIKDEGIEVVLISNNVEERVSNFAKPLDVPYYPFAKKPLKLTYKKMLKDYQDAPSEVAIIGDQLLTDVLGAKRMKFYTILTKPVAQKDLKCTKINRIFEQFIYWRLEKKKMLVKGAYYD